MASILFSVLRSGPLSVLRHLDDVLRGDLRGARQVRVRPQASRKLPGSFFGRKSQQEGTVEGSRPEHGLCESVSLVVGVFNIMSKK